MLTAVLVLVVIVAVIMVVVAAVKSGAGKGGDDVIKSVYIYLVLFATLMMTIGGSVAAFVAAADIVAPTPYYQTFEDYRQRYYEKPAIEGERLEAEQISEQELRERYDAMLESERLRQVNLAKNDLLKSLGWIIIPLPVFLYFQKLRKEEG